MKHEILLSLEVSETLKRIFNHLTIETLSTWSTRDLRERRDLGILRHLVLIKKGLIRRWIY